MEELSSLTPGQARRLALFFEAAADEVPSARADIERLHLVPLVAQREVVNRALLRGMTHRLGARHVLDLRLDRGDAGHARAQLLSFFEAESRETRQALCMETPMLFPVDPAPVLLRLAQVMWALANQTRSPAAAAAAAAAEQAR